MTIQAQIIDLMNHLKKEIGTSIMFITHDLGVVAETCDEVVVMYCGRVVEKGNVYDIFGKTAHPYTQGLLKSIPKLGEHVEELDSIPGNVPNPKYMPKGCKFAPGALTPQSGAKRKSRDSSISETDTRADAGSAINKGGRLWQKIY